MMGRYFSIILALLWITPATLAAMPPLPTVVIHQIDPADPHAPYYPSLKRESSGWLFSRVGAWKILIARAYGGGCQMSDRSAKQSIDIVTFPSKGVMVLRLGDLKLAGVMGETNTLSYGFDGKFIVTLQDAGRSPVASNAVIGTRLIYGLDSDRFLSSLMAAHVLNFTVNGHSFARKLPGGAEAVRELLRCQSFVAQERLSTGIGPEEARTGAVPLLYVPEDQENVESSLFSTAGAWSIRAVRRPVGCAATAIFANGTRLDLLGSLDDRPILLMVSNPVWNLRSHVDHPLTLQLEDDPPAAGQATPLTYPLSTRILDAAVPLDIAYARSLWSKTMLRISLDGDDNWYRLDDADMAGREVERCRATLANEKTN